jgi:hypothetical protein
MTSITSLSHSRARFALTSRLAVLHMRQWMPSLAVRLSRISSRWAHAAERIDTPCHGLQMGRIGASRISAKVIYDKRLVNWPVCQFVGYAMHWLDAILSSPNRQVGIAERVDIAGPWPALIGRTLVHSTPESFADRQHFPCFHPYILSERIFLEQQ